MLQEEVKRIFNDYPEIIYGVSNIDFSEYRKDYKCALVFAVPHAKIMDTYHYQENEFERLVCEARECRYEVMDKIEGLLKKSRPPIDKSSVPSNN